MLKKCMALLFLFSIFIWITLAANANQENQDKPRIEKRSHDKNTFEKRRDWRKYLLMMENYNQHQATTSKINKKKKT